MRTILLTGFPGFLGSALLPRILARLPRARALCLVQDQWMAEANSRLEELAASDPGLMDRVDLVPGDITRPGLGLEDPARVASDLLEVHHLAAVYDLSVGPDLARAVNVDGTRHVLDLCRAAPRLDRLFHVSTCYVGGTTEGVFREDDLERGQGFNNPYEETKYLSEVLVREAMAEGVPATVFRPAVVVGDSATGATRKYDGPYFVIRWILRQPGVALLPVVGDPGRHALNVVPSDFVVDAMAALAANPASRGRTYQLADPSPPSVDELIRAIGTATGRRIVRVPLPRRVAEGALRHVPGLSTLMGIPADAVPYFTHPTRYDVTQTLTDLRGSGVEPVSLLEILPTLVRFVRDHPEVGSSPMV
jgi:thioester reductase-like protein